MGIQVGIVKKISTLVAVVAASTLGLSLAQAGHVDIGVNLGGLFAPPPPPPVVVVPAPVVVAPAPVVVAQPVYAPAPVVVAQPVYAPAPVVVAQPVYAPAPVVVAQPAPVVVVAQPAPIVVAQPVYAPAPVIVAPAPVIIEDRYHPRHREEVIVVPGRPVAPVGGVVVDVHAGGH